MKYFVMFGLFLIAFSLACVGNDSEAMSDDGYINEQVQDTIVGCPEDTKLCPNGLILIRVPPECDFELCTDELLNIDSDSPSVVESSDDLSETEQKVPECSDDKQICEDGTIVSRVLPDCQFEDCPEPIDQSADYPESPAEDENESFPEDEYECLNHDDCEGGDVCILGRCENCGNCFFIDEEGLCRDCVCCENGDCSDNIGSTRDTCENAGTHDSYCVNTPLVDLYPLRVLMIEFAPQNVQYGTLYLCQNDALGYYLQNIEEYCDNLSEAHSFLEILNNPSWQIAFDDLREEDMNKVPHSLAYLEEFYKNEALRYGVTTAGIFEIDVIGPFELDGDPPSRGRDDNTDVEMVEFFEQKSSDFSIDVTEYDIISYIYLNDQALSQRDYPGFVSFSYGDHEIIVNSISTSEFSDDAVQTIAHELAHTLGATDKYIEPCPHGSYFSCCMDPEGIPEPNKSPKYPQDKACLMCSDIALTQEGDSQGTGNLDNNVICEKTAQEMGWQ